MAVKNFIPELWSEKILRDLDKKQMLVKHCTKKWSGKIEGVGSKVRINSIKTPTIGDYVPGSTTVTPEELQDEARWLEITESKYFSFFVGRIEDKQAQGEYMSEGMRKATVALRDAQEQFVASKYTEAGTTVTEASLTSANVFSTFMQAKEYLLENNVSEEAEIVAEVSPAVYTKVILAHIVNTDNGDMIKKGKFSESLGMTFYVSNNLSKTGDASHCLVRTTEAVAFAEQIMEVKEYEPEADFSKAVKGLCVFGAKVVDPEQMVHLELTTAAETAI